jgi:elongation factor Ts
MAVSVEQVRELRDRTGAGVLDAKKALEAHDGDIDAAIQALREKGLASAAKKAGRAATDGRIISYIHGDPGRIGVLLELNCETDFVARTGRFQELARELAMQVAAARPDYVRDEDIPSDVLEAERATLTAQIAGENKPPDILAKIADGKLSKWMDQVVLMRQPFIKQPDIAVADLVKSAIAELGENIVVGRFARFELGQ